MNVPGFMKSTGVKRVIASILAVLYGLASIVPGLDPAIKALEWLAGIIGGVGVVHAITAESIGKAKLAAISSLLSSLVVIAMFVPAMAPIVPALLKAASIIGAMAVGVKIAQES